MPIESYDHRGKQRLNNPPVGMHYVLKGPNFSKWIPSRVVADRGIESLRNISIWKPDLRDAANGVA